MEDLYDVLIIGGGPGGYVSAIKSKQLGLKVALVEQDNLGGICLNWGCIPTKSLLRVAEIKNHIEHSNDYGIIINGKVDIDINKIVQRSREISQKLTDGIKYLIKKNKVDHFNGIGKISSLNKDYTSVSVSSNKNNFDLKSKNIVIATGAKPKTIPNINTDNENIWNFKDAMVPNEIPKSIIIVGSGAIGIEFASFYNDMGSKVTVIEMEKNILPSEDQEISDFAEKVFTEKGIKFYKNSTLVSCDDKKSPLSCKILSENKEITIKSDKVLISVGIKANIDSIGIENTDIKTKNGYILTDIFMETDHKNIYAIGDVTAPPWLAHKASHEGIICAEKIAGIKDLHLIPPNSIPACTYCSPQIASIGLSEKNAKEKGFKIKVGRFPFSANGRAITHGDDSGFIKTIFDESSGELLGAHMIGPEVTELIQGFSIAKKLETTELELFQTIFPHPTLSEGIHESVLQAYNKAIHI